MSTRKIKVTAPVGAPTLAQQDKPIAIKGTLYVLPNGDQFFECADNHPKSATQTNEYKLVFSDGVTKHWTTKRRHLFLTSFNIETTEPIGTLYLREVAHFCAEAAVKGVKYYVQ
jgi:hypothetical protein